MPYCEERLDMRSLKFLFLILWLLTSSREGDAFPLEGGAPSLSSTGAVHLAEEADGSKKDPNHSAPDYLAQRSTKRKPDITEASCVTQYIFLPIHPRSWGGVYCSRSVSEESCSALYRLLHVYRC